MDPDVKMAAQVDRASQRERALRFPVAKLDGFLVDIITYAMVTYSRKFDSQLQVLVADGGLCYRPALRHADGWHGRMSGEQRCSIFREVFLPLIPLYFNFGRVR